MKKANIVSVKAFHYARKDGSSTVDYKAILTGVMSKLYKGDKGKEVVTLLNSDDATPEAIQEAILDADKARIADLNKGKTFQDGYSKAKKEERAALEAEIKSKYGIDEESEGHELTGPELIEFVVKDQAGQAAGKAAGKDVSKLTADEIKALPGYVAIAKDFKKQLADTEKTWSEKYNGLESAHKNEATFGKFSAFALSKLNEFNPIVSKTATVAQTHQKNFLNALKEGRTIRENEDGTFSLLTPDGKIVEDGHGNPLDPADLVKSVAANFYEFQASNGGGNSGNNNNGGRSGASAQGKGKVAYPTGYSSPKNEEEYAKVMMDMSIDRATRNAYSAAYNSEASATGE